MNIKFYHKLYLQTDTPIFYIKVEYFSTEFIISFNSDNYNCEVFYAAILQKLKIYYNSGSITQTALRVYKSYVKIGLDVTFAFFIYFVMISSEHYKAFPLAKYIMSSSFSFCLNPYYNTY